MVKSLMTMRAVLDHEEIALPSVRLKTALLRTLAPSRNCKVAAMVWPLVPTAVMRLTSSSS